MFEAHFQLRRARRRRRADRAAVGLSRGAGAAQAHRVCDFPRRSATKRVCRALRRAAGVADRLHRIGRNGHRADATRPRCSSMAATRCRRQSRSIARPGHIEPLSIRRRKLAGEHLTAGDRLGFDPWLHTSAAAERLAAACAKAGAELVAVDCNPLDSIWTERPPPPLGPVAVHGTQFSGEARPKSSQRIRLEIDTPRRRRAGAVGFARGGLDLQHPRRRRLAYAAAAVLCAGAEGRPSDRLHRSPQAVEQRPRPSRTDPPMSGAGRADGSTHRPGAARRASRSTAPPPPMR